MCSSVCVSCGSCYFVIGLVMCCFFFFFFRQKTPYEMRIRDWSSDVCSSELGFSQGACLASHFMWCGAAKMGFLGSLTGSLPGFELPTAPVEPRFTGLKAIFTGGLNDDWVKAEHVREAAERFRL